MVENTDTAQFSFVEMEHEILKFWEDTGTFQKSLDNTKEKKPYIFYEQDYLTTAIWLPAPLRTLCRVTGP